MLINLIDDLLDLAKEESLTFTFNKIYFNMIEVINGAFNTLQFISESKNLSTFIIKSRLTEYLKEKKITYGGVYCSLPDSWVGGWGIIMNDISADKLQKMAPKFKDTSNEVPDDFLIGKILKTSDITCENGDYMGYIWDYKLSFDRNIHNIDETPTNIFIRLRTDNLSEYDVVIKNLYNIYG